MIFPSTCATYLRAGMLCCLTFSLVLAQSSLTLTESSVSSPHVAVEAAAELARKNAPDAVNHLADVILHLKHRWTLPTGVDRVIGQRVLNAELAYRNGVG